MEPGPPSFILCGAGIDLIDNNCMQVVMSTEQGGPSSSVELMLGLLMIIECRWSCVKSKVYLHALLNLGRLMMTVQVMMSTEPAILSPSVELMLGRQVMTACWWWMQNQVRLHSLWFLCCTNWWKYLCPGGDIYRGGQGSGHASGGSRESQVHLQCPVLSGTVSQKGR